MKIFYKKGVHPFKWYYIPLKSIVGCILAFTLCLAPFTGICEGTKISTYLNGNEVSQSFDDGIFTAMSSGKGIFAIALYRENELISLELTNSEDTTERYKVNSVIDLNDADTLKVFRFDENMNPLCINTTLIKEKTDNIRIHLNENFDSGTKYDIESNNASVLNGTLKVTGNGQDTRCEMFPIYNSDRYLVIEADFKLDSANYVWLISNNYSGAPIDFVRINTAGIQIGNTNTTIVNTADIDFDKAINISLQFDLESFTYDIYVNKQKKASDVSLNGKVNPSDKRSLSLTIPRILSNSSRVLVDNLKAYSSDTIIEIGKNIGNSIADVHKTDYPSDVSNITVYGRPSAEELASNILNSTHPRLIMNSDKIKEIKLSTDLNIIDWKNAVVAKADSLLSQDTYNYISAQSDSRILDSAIELMQCLGIAYLLNGDTVYAQRAYKEAHEIITKWHDWGSPDALNTAEVSYALSVCYDWLYEGLSQSQRDEISQSVLENSIYPTYKLYNGQNPGMTITESSWWKSDNNWNAVCNGCAFMTSAVFMEEDAFCTATIAEASLRGLEYIMARFAPSGGWAEGPDYWSHSMKYITAAMATLESTCGKLYGFTSAKGFSRTHTYSLALEGKYNIVNLGDTELIRIDAPFMFYWSRIFDESSYTSAQLYLKNKFNLPPTPYDLIYYTPDMNKPGFEVPTSFYYEGTEVVTFASGTDDDDTYIAISGGKGHSTSHDHLDSGAVVVDMRGERLLWDIGAESYDADGYFSDNRHKFFRARPEAHNIFVINPTDISDNYCGQSLDAVSKITSKDLEAKTATMDLTEAYARDVDDAKRTISLVDDKVNISDNIILKGSGNEICWSWYLKASEIDISDETVVVTQNGKSFKITFDASNPVSVSRGEAIQYINTDPDPDGKKNSNTAFTKLVVKMQNASGKISLNTTIE